METSSDQFSGSSGVSRSVADGELKEQAGQIKDQAKSMAREAAHSGQTAAAEHLSQFAQGVRRSADSWDDGQHAWVKQSLATAADQIDQFSSTLRERDLSSLVDEAEMAARRHPALFALGCAVAGFALVRFLKSSGKESPEHYAGQRSGEYESAGYRSDGRSGDHQSGGYGSQSAGGYSPTDI